MFKGQQHLILLRAMELFQNTFFYWFPSICSAINVKLKACIAGGMTSHY